MLAAMLVHDCKPCCWPPCWYRAAGSDAGRHVGSGLRGLMLAAVLVQGSGPDAGRHVGAGQRGLMLAAMLVQGCGA